MKSETLELGHGDWATITLEADTLSIALVFGSVEYRFRADGHIDNSSGGYPRTYVTDGQRYRLINSSASLSISDGCVELVSTPAVGDSRQPWQALEYILRFESAEGALRVTAWFETEQETRCNELTALTLKPEFTVTALSGDGYRTESLENSLFTSEMRVETAQGALNIDGGVLWTDDHCLIPSSALPRSCDLRLLNRSRPLCFTVAPDGLKAKKKEFEALRGVPTGTLYTLGETVIEVRGNGASMAMLPFDGTEPFFGDIPAPLTRLELKNVRSGEVFAVDSQSGWQQVDVRSGKNTLLIDFQVPRGIEDIHVLVELRNTGDTSTWRTTVINNSDAYSVLSAAYPALSVYGHGLALVEPRDCGVLREDVFGRHFHATGTYPRGKEYPMPFFALLDGCAGRGLYIALHDMSTWRQDISLDFFETGEGVITFNCPADNMGRAGNSFSLPGELVRKRYDGDWYDAALIYRSFILNHAPWLPEHGRPDTPDWMRSVPLYIMDWMPNTNPDSDPLPISIRPEREQSRDAWYKKAVRLADTLGVELGYHLYNWHFIPFNNDYPYYFPTKPAFRQGVAELKRHGVHVMPYVNARLWDTHDARGDDGAYPEKALPAASKRLDGDACTETYASHEPDGQLCRLASMCPSTALWKKTLCDIMKRLFEDYGVDGVYCDQVGTSIPTLCCDGSHNHTPGNGAWWVDSYALLMKTLRTVTPAQGGYSTEDHAQVYMNSFDAFLTWQWIGHNQIPLWSAVYAGYIQLFGRNTNGYNRHDVTYVRANFAEALMFGQQLGWINADIVDEPVLLAFLKVAVAMRVKYTRYFTDGSMQHPPRVPADAPRYITRSGMNRPEVYNTCVIKAAQWCLEGKSVVLIANAGDSDFEGELILADGTRLSVSIQAASVMDIPR